MQVWCKVLQAGCSDLPRAASLPLSGASRIGKMRPQDAVSCMYSMLMMYTNVKRKKKRKKKKSSPVAPAVSSYQMLH